MLNSRKAAQHCRETMEACRRITAKTDLGLNDLDAEQSKIYTTHRRVFDSNTATLMVASDMLVSTMAVQRAAIPATRRADKTSRQTLLTDANDVIDALLRRKKRHARSAEDIENDKVKSKTAKAHMQQRNGD